MFCGVLALFISCNTSHVCCTILLSSLKHDTRPLTVCIVAAHVGSCAAYVCSLYRSSFKWVMTVKCYLIKWQIALYSTEVVWVICQGICKRKWPKSQYSLVTLNYDQLALHSVVTLWCQSAINGLWGQNWLGGQRRHGLRGSNVKTV